MAEDEKVELPEETPQDEAEVEGHGVTVEEFNADGRNIDTVCGQYYSSV